MPGDQHEAMVEVFRQSPRFIGELLAKNLSFGIHEIDEFQFGESQLSKAPLHKLSPDLLLLMRRRQKNLMAVIVEVQRQVDGRKEESWPMYLISTAYRYHCPVELLVVTPSPQVERWAQKKRMLNPRGTCCWQPEVLGPSLLKAANPAQSPQWDVLRAMVFGERDLGVLHRALQSLQDLDEPTQSIYHDLLRRLLSTSTWRNFEMAYQYPQSDFAKKHHQTGLAEGLAEGQAQGEASARKQMLESLLTAKFGILDAQTKEQLSKGSAEQLQNWAIRLLTAESLAEIFEDS